MGGRSARRRARSSKRERDSSEQISWSLTTTRNIEGTGATEILSGSHGGTEDTESCSTATEAQRPQRVRSTATEAQRPQSSSFNSHGGTQSTRRFYVLKCHGGGGVRESFGSSVTKRGAHEDRPGLRSRLATRAAFDGDASSLAALSFIQVFPVFLVVAPCQPGASPISCDAPVHPQAAAAAGSRLHTQAIASARPIRDRRRALEPRHPTSAVPATRRSDSQRALVARFEQGGEPPPPDRRMMSSRVLRQKAESQGRNQSRLFDCHSCLVNCAVPPSRRQARSDGAHQRLAPTRALSAIAEHAL